MRSICECVFQDLALSSPDGWISPQVVFFSCKFSTCALTIWDFLALVLSFFQPNVNFLDKLDSFHRAKSISFSEMSVWNFAYILIKHTGVTIKWWIGRNMYHFWYLMQTNSYFIICTNHFADFGTMYAHILCIPMWWCHHFLLILLHRANAI